MSLVVFLEMVNWLFLEIFDFEVVLLLGWFCYLFGVLCVLGLLEYGVCLYVVVDLLLVGGFLFFLVLILGLFEVFDVVVVGGKCSVEEFVVLVIDVECVVGVESGGMD